MHFSVKMEMITAFIGIISCVGRYVIEIFSMIIVHCERLQSAHIRRRALGRVGRGARGVRRAVSGAAPGLSACQVSSRTKVKGRW